MVALLKIIRYVTSTIDQGLNFPSGNPLTLTAYCDSDWGTCKASRRSITGYCFFLGSSLITWQSKKQTIVSRSSKEALYRCLAMTTCELLLLHVLLKDFLLPISLPTMVMVDNEDAISLASNLVQHDRTKLLI